MLVDLGRNDLGRVCEYGTVNVSDFFAIERYSHVMHIVSHVEPDARGAYAGMVGYFGFDGTMDTCLAIRTMIGHGDSVSVQAGAGIVADSNPASEYQETVNKASALLRAIEMVEAKE